MLNERERGREGWGERTLNKSDRCSGEAGQGGEEDASKDGSNRITPLIMSCKREISQF